MLGVARRRDHDVDTLVRQRPLQQRLRPRVHTELVEHGSGRRPLYQCALPERPHDDDCDTELGRERKQLALGLALVRVQRQLHRFEAARKHLLELPAGTLEEGEQPLDSAKRELEEETGLTGGTWRKLGGFWTTPGFCREYMHLFAAQDVESGDANPEEDEELEIVRWDVHDIPSKLDEIEDAKTLAGLLLYLRKVG